ncbi:hypothetical protein [Pseudomonas fontis]|uniref:HNH endonuclease n=1 Tax=Pseudomonas fontis TaxID=2942633 RepID=A0ABT5NQH5_9PSED|nr:hypothetical protein [Pseudomonas fontis]MDD0974631.1 hypothetical protein [Pseudomonas fontis]MDD0990426.1 hypothetical protein [Pseudomonas fontis]
MKLYLEGDRGKALCEHCQQLVATVYARRDVPFSDGHGEAKDILVGVCESCEAVVAVPPQSTPAIKASRKQQLISIEARLPAVYLDVLDAAMHLLAQEAGLQLRKLVLSYYFRVLAEHEAGAANLNTTHQSFIQALAQQRLARQLPLSRSMKRLSMKVNHFVAEDFEVLLQATRLSQTDLLKSVIAQIQQDVLEQGNPSIIEDLQRLTRVAL